MHTSQSVGGPRAGGGSQRLAQADAPGFYLARPIGRASTRKAERAAAILRLPPARPLAQILSSASPRRGSGDRARAQPIDDHRIGSRLESRLLGGAGQIDRSLEGRLAIEIGMKGLE